MENNILEIEAASGLVEMLLHKKDNNIDGLDNLDEIPQAPAVYAICGRVNGKAANCRYIGSSENLKSAILHHFSSQETFTCLRDFMQSIKIKMLVYQTFESYDKASIETNVNEWKNKFKPECNDALNKIH